MKIIRRFHPHWAGPPPSSFANATTRIADAPPIPTRGVVVTPTVFDPETHRTMCGRCQRVLATGVAACICGAEFVGYATA